MGFKEQPQRVHPPVTSQCTRCETQYKADDLRRHVLKKQKKEPIGEGHGHLIPPLIDDPKESDRAMEHFAALPRIPALPDAKSTQEKKRAYENFMLGLVLLTQRHSWKH